MSARRFIVIFTGADQGQQTRTYRTRTAAEHAAALAEERGRIAYVAMVRP